MSNEDVKLPTAFAARRTFPVSVDIGAGKRAVDFGITLREDFAGRALQGMLASESDDNGHYKPEHAAERAVEFADALIAELEKHGPAPHDIASGEIG